MKSRWVIGILLAFALLMLGETPGAGEKSRQRGVPAEIARLRGEVARLRTAVDFLARQQPGEGAPSNGGICGDPCASDSDGDGANDCEDPCPCEATHGDGDGDGTPDCVDPCPDDPTDACTDPCTNDSDGDGIGDCEDPCPYDPGQPIDGDGDGTPDCQDPCPEDPSNQCSDPCALDQDGDGVPDCRDECPWAGPEAGGSGETCVIRPQ